jgi:hypothetical protein
MEDPYTLEGDALDLFKKEFELIRILLEMQEDQDSLVFDLAWLPSPMHRELFVQLAENKALRKSMKTHKYSKLQTRKRYSPKNLENFITYMGYGRSGMGTQYTTRNRATPAQAKESYKKAITAMIKEFNTFALNTPRNVLGHGLGRPIRQRQPVYNNNNYNNYNNNYNNDNNNDDNEHKKKGSNIHINNNNITYGRKKRMGMKTSSKYIRKDSPHSGTKKIKHEWVRANKKLLSQNNND